MHELSVAESLLEVALENCSNQGFNSVGSIKVLIGKASGVMPDALLFGFNAVKEGTAADQAILEIEEECRSQVTAIICEKDFTTEDVYVLNCPHCEGVSFTIKTGS